MALFLTFERSQAIETINCHKMGDSMAPFILYHFEEFRIKNNC